MRRQRKAMILGCCLALVFFLASVSMAAEAEPKVGQVVGNVKFGKPIADEDAKYLGLGKVAEFTLKDIKAPYMLVEQMNTT